MQQSKICSFSFCNESRHHITDCQNLVYPSYCRSQNLSFNGYTKYNCPGEGEDATKQVEIELIPPPNSPVQCRGEEEDEVSQRNQFQLVIPTKQVEIELIPPPNSPVPKKKTFDVNITLSPTKQVQKTPISLEDNEDIFARFLNTNVQNLILSEIPENYSRC